MFDDLGDLGEMFDSCESVRILANRKTADKLQKLQIIVGFNWREPVRTDDGNLYVVGKAFAPVAEKVANQMRVACRNTGMNPVVQIEW